MKKISLMPIICISSIIAMLGGLCAHGESRSLSRVGNAVDSDGSVFTLDVVSRIDLKSGAFSEAGIGFAVEFDVDDSGSIFFIAYKSAGYYVYRVSEKGRLLNSFGRMGQGPGELDLPISPAVLNDGNIAITDRNRKIVIYSDSGSMVSEERFDLSFTDAVRLRTGGYLMQRSSYDRSRPDYIKRELVLLDDNKCEVKILDSLNEVKEDALRDGRLVPYFVWEATADRIYTMSEDRGYEILVYDHKGNLLNKIIGKPRRVKATEDIKRSVLGPAYGKSSKPNYFPNPLPPVNHFFADDEGHVFAMTYERDPQSGFYLYDIFNNEGAYLGSQGIQTIWAGLYFANKGIVAKKGKLYCWREDRDGDWEFIIQRINWLRK
jgi:hypothetical protein